MKAIRSTCLLFSLGLSSSSYALIQGEAFLGQRSIKFESQGVHSDTSGSLQQIGVNLDPIPLVPVSFGAHMTKSDYSSTSKQPKGSGLEVGVEVKAWLPMVPFITPYGRASYIASGKYEFSGDVSQQMIDSVYDVSGSALGVGVDWSPVPFVGIMLELQAANYSLDPTKNKMNGADVVNSPKMKGKATDVLLGVNVGF